MSSRSDSDEEAEEPQNIYEEDSENGTNALHLVESRQIDREIEEADIKENGYNPKMFWIALRDYLRPDFMIKHLEWQSVKIVGRTWVTWWVLLLLITIVPVDRWFGSSAYLLIIAAILESSGGVSIGAAFVTSFLDLGFACYGFLHLCVASAINWRLRGYITEEDAFNEVVNAGLCAAGDSVCFQQQLHRGHFLTTRTTIISVFAMIIALTSLGLPATQRRIFALPWFFSVISVVIVGTYTNFTPWFEPWLYGRAIIIPMGISLALRTLFCCIWFPVTSSYKFLSIVLRGISDASTLLETYGCQEHLRRPSDPGFSQVYTDYASKTQKIHQTFGLLDLDGIITQYEIAYARLDPGNLGELRSLTRVAAGMIAGLEFFHDAFVDKIQQSSKFKRLRQATFSSTEHYHAIPGVHTSWIEKRFDRKLNKRYKHSGTFERHHQNFALSDQAYLPPAELDAIWAAITNHYQGVLTASSLLLREVSEWLRAANEFRLTILPYSYSNHERIQIERSQALQRAHGQLLEELDAIAEPSTWLNGLPLGLRKSHLSFLLGEDAQFRLITRQCALRAERLASYCLLLDERQPRPRWIIPFLTKSQSRMPRFESEYIVDDEINLSAGNTAAAFHAESRVQGRDPDSSPPRNLFHLAGLKVLFLYGLITNPQFLFCAKRASLTVAGLSLYFFRTTIFVAYGHRLVWVGIMIAFTVTQQAVDGIYGFFVKLVFTTLGLGIGLAAWYISTGNGRGNSYGLCAIMAFVLLILAFHRHFQQHRIPAGSIILTATITLIVGTSWSDEHVPVPDMKLGKGWDVAWVRFVTVIVGLAIGFLGTIFPHAKTGKKSIRVVLAMGLERVGVLHSAISTFGLQRMEDANVHIIGRDDPIMRLRIRLLSGLRIATAIHNNLNFEPPLGGVWPRHRYELLIKLQREIVQLYAYIHHLLNEVHDTSKIPALLQRIGWTSSEMSSGLYSVLYMTSQALATGKPLPTVTPGYLSEIYAIQIQHMVEFDGGSNIIEQRYLDSDGRLVLAGVILASQIYRRIDGIMILIKGLVGELFDVRADLYDYDSDEAALAWRYDVNSKDHFDKSHHKSNLSVQ